MKFSTLFGCFLLLLPFGSLHAQNCSAGSSQIDITTDRVQVRNLAAGTFWWDSSDSRFLVNDDQLSAIPTSVAFAGGLWLGGVDPGGNLKLAAQTYGLSSGQTDFWPGPLDDQGLTTSNACENFDRIWEIKKEDLDAHVADYADNGMIDNPVPPSILSWPGKDNPLSVDNNGFELPSGRNLAPFADVNNDNIYNPEDGDYPRVRNAEVAQWWIFNDNGNIHSESNGDPLRAEVSVLAYTFDTDQSINSTIFYELEIINKAQETIMDFHVGLWVDPDLGCFDDDHIGCSPEDNLAYTYNADAIDGDASGVCVQGIPTFSSGIPLFGVKILEGVKDQTGNDLGMTAFTYYNNQGVGGPWPAGTTDPQTAIEYYNYLRGTWRDGTPISQGGTGYDPSSTDITTFAFPGDPTDADQWSECTANTVAGDRRYIISSGGIDLQPGAITKVAYAAIVTGAVTHPCPDISPLIDAANVAQETYENTILKNNNITASTEFTISPNPTNDFVNINLFENERIESIKVLTSNGKMINEFLNINSTQYDLDLSNFSSGIYFLEVWTQTGKHGINRVVKL